ncbi:39S ribosomal protein L40, mitochondrial-like [Anneissia japonica]|uniref:39S ribosomal protein L40, mitochondrial-like n=1 Tax=Anneissia japonica TaxID=1529436 RepID=UPI0014258661|nr:39S ribosomal protein L40, mitochondrial-like [Anneissia japonica]
MALFIPKILSSIIRVSNSVASSSGRNFHTQAGGLAFHFTQILNAEPPKKKKKADPKLEQMRKQRMIKRLRKVQFKMGAAELKPVQEFSIDRKLKEETRKRDLPEITYEESERRALLQKEWSKYKFQLHCDEMKYIKSMLKSQQKALEELKYESVELYELAMTTDKNLMPLVLSGPTETPPILDYYHQCPDGQYVDISKQYK